MTDRFAALSALGLLAIVGGCTVGPDFKRPTVPLPAAWQEAPAPVTPGRHAAQEREGPLSWAAFNDPALDRLLERGGADNLDIRAAAIRIEEARIQHGAAKAEGMPSLNGSAAYSRERLSTAGVAGVVRPLFGLPAGADGPDAFSFNDYSVGAAASWELDLWGRQRRLREAAGAQLEATTQEAAAMRLSAQAEIARTYFLLRRLNEMIGELTQTLALTQDAAHAASASAVRGLLASADLAAPYDKVHKAAAALEEARVNRDATRRALAVLVGGRPDAPLPELDTQPLRHAPPAIGPTLPSDLARNRPDILAARARLHAATAAIGVARADFYPSITLSGQLSLDALKLEDLGWGSRNTSFGPSLSLPIFSGGRLERRLELKRAQERGAALAYQSTVIAAWREVENAFAQMRLADAKAAQLTASEQGEAARLAQMARRLARGDLPRTQLDEEKASHLETLRQMRDQQSQALIARVNLITALGPA